MIPTYNTLQAFMSAQTIPIMFSENILITFLIILLNGNLLEDNEALQIAYIQSTVQAMDNLHQSENGDIARNDQQNICQLLN